MSGPPGGQQGQSTIADAEPSGPGTEMEMYCNLSAMGKENAAAVQLSRYIKDRVPARSALRKSLAPGAEDGMKSLLSNFNALQETMAHFNQDSSRRRESLTGKEGATGIEKDNPPVAQKASTLASNPAANASAPAPTGLQHRPPLNRPPLPLPPAPARAMQCETSQDQGMDLDDSQQGTDAASSTHTMVCIPAAIASTKHGKAAIDLFLDPLLTKALHDILNRRLQRTKDGATDKTRIQELAGKLKQANGYLDQA